MRLIVINAARDPELERLRRRHPGKVLQRPTIVDAPLAYPSGRRVLPTEMLTAAVVDRLEYLVSIGNIRVLEMGARSTPVDFNALRQRLGHPTHEASVEGTERLLDRRLGEIVELQEAPPPAPSEDAAPAVPATPSEGPAVSDIDKAQVAALGEAAIPEVASSAAEGAALEDVLGELGAEPPAPEVLPVATAEAWVAPAELESLLSSSKGKPLAAALAVFGKSGAGKAKLVMVGELTELFAGDADPVNKFKAVEILRAAQLEA